jgi:hypothetical protein
MQIAIEQQNIAQLGCAFDADRVLIAEKYVLRSLPCQVDYRFALDCCGLFRSRTALIEPGKKVSQNLLAAVVI